MSTKEFTEQVVADFMCLRSHHDHPWGLQVVRVNGEKAYAIVREGNDDEHNNVFAIILPIASAKLEITNMFGRPILDNLDIPIGPVKVTN